jgi:hypothetical protein
MTSENRGRLLTLFQPDRQLRLRLLVIEDEPVRPGLPTPVGRLEKLSPAQTSPHRRADDEGGFFQKQKPDRAGPLRPSYNDACMEGSQISPKSRLITLLFCLLLGVFGVHRFYVGKIGTGVLMLVTLGGLGIWWLVDVILVAVGSFRDATDRRVFRWMEPDPS